jgi:signal peptidase II
MRNAHAAAIETTDAKRIALLMIAAAWLTDYSTKSWAVWMMRDGTMELGRLSLEVVANPAFAFSLGEGMVAPEVVALTRAMGVLAIAVFLRIIIGAHQTLRSLIGYGLIVGGGLGNTLDHLVQGGAVVDFIAIGNIVFNVADVWIVLGITLIYPAIRVYSRSAERNFYSS